MLLYWQFQGFENHQHSLLGYRRHRVHFWVIPPLISNGAYKEIIFVFKIFSFLSLDFRHWRNSRKRQCGVHDCWRFVACRIHQTKQSTLDCWVGFERNCHSCLGSPTYCFCRRDTLRDTFHRISVSYSYTLNHLVQTLDFGVSWLELEHCKQWCCLKNEI